MKILIALHDYLPLHTGGSEVHAHQTARELVRRGHDVLALFTERDLAAEEGSLRRGELDGVRTLECVHQREYADVRETWVQERAGAAFREVLADFAPEVVHFHHLAFWGSGVLPAAKHAGARTLVTLHDYHLLCDAATLLRPDDSLCDEGLPGHAGDCSACLRRHPLLPERWEGGASASREALWQRAAKERYAKHRRDLAAADVVLSPSRFLAERFASAGFVDLERVELLRAGYPGPLRPPRRRDPSQPLRLAYVGGIYPVKGVHVLIAALQRLRDLPVELHVYGHLDWFPEYVESLRRTAKGSAVTFHGPFAPRDIDLVLAQRDALVVPSLWYENMPITVQEAFRNGLPVVATAIGGMAEAVHDGVDGLTFPRGDVSALASALRRLAEEPALYDRLAAGRTPPPTLESIVDRLEALYPA